MKRILCATDYSKASGRALDEAVNLAKQNKAELWVVHVIEPLGNYVSGEDFGGAELYMRLEESTMRDAQASMKKLMQRLERLGIKAKSLLLKGTPYQQIVKAARSKKADMIVVGTHGRHGLSHLLLGSVAEGIVRVAAKPVLLIRGE